MKLRLPGWRSGAASIDPGSGPPEFEFAHLLDAGSHVGVDIAPDVTSEPVPDATSEPVPDLTPASWPEIVPEPVPEIVPEPVAEIVPEPVADVVVSRFADSGLDDDRLPIVVKRRRTRRR